MRRLPLLLLALACGDTDPGPSTEGSTPPLTELPPASWSYVPVEGMACGNGQPTGIGVNPGTSDEVLFLVAGGGACWDAVSCFVLDAAVHITTGWGEAQLHQEVGVLEGHPLLDRSAADSPMGEATWIYVPYCTGDLHAGSRVGDYAPAGTVHHVGDDNVRALLAWAAEEIPVLDRLWLVGISAGGFGIQLQADRFAAAWPEAELALLADGAPMVGPYYDRWWAFQSAWDLRLPEGCPECVRFPEILAHQVATLPDARFGLATYRDDGVVTVYLNFPIGGLGPATDTLLEGPYAEPGVEAFVLPGDAHVMLPGLDTLTAPDGTSFRAWVDAWATGSSAFVTVP